MSSKYGFENSQDRVKQAQEREYLIASTAERVAPLIPVIDDVMIDFAAARQSRLKKDLMKDGISWEVFSANPIEPMWSVSIGYESKDPHISIRVNQPWLDDEDSKLGDVLHRETGLRVEMRGKYRFDDISGTDFTDRKTFWS
jgi:hypothetical protein